MISIIVNLMSNDQVKLLDHHQVAARLRRMAFEVYEANYQEQSLIIIGIDERGGHLADLLAKHLKEISPLSISLYHAHLDRQSDPHAIGIDLSIESIEALKDQPILVVDDVLYSGYTLLNVVAILLQAAPSSIQTAVLIDRGHRRMPVSSDFVGMILSTTIHQHVKVEIKPESNSAEAFLT